MESRRKKPSFFSVARVVAIVIASAISGVLFCLAIQQQAGSDRMSALIGCVLFTLVWLGLLSPAAMVGKRPRIENILMVVAAGGLLLVILFAVTSRSFDPEMIAACWVILPPLVLIVVWRARVLRNSRRRAASMVLMYVEQAVRLNLALPEILAAAAAGESGAVRARLELLRESLENGTPLDEALPIVAPELSPETLRSITAAQRMGRLPRRLHELAASRTSSSARPAPDPDAFYEAYPFAVLTMLAVVTTLMLETVVPKFQGILKDFHQVIPPSMRLMLELITNPVLAAILIGLCGGALIWSFCSIFFAQHVWFAEARNLRLQVMWWIPLARAYVRDRGLADLCRTVADAAAAGVPMDQAIAQSTVMAPSAPVEQRAARWAQEIASGSSLPDSARSAGLPRLMSRMLATVRDEQSLGAVMYYLAQYYDYRFARARAVLRAAIHPAVVLIMGSLVALLAMSVFQTMALLVKATADSQGGF